MLLVAACASCAAAPGARARTLHTVLEDDALSLFAPQALPSFVRELRWLGVDVLRISAEWKLEVPAPDSPVAPAGFDPADPRAYDTPAMHALDRAVRAAAAAGLQVMIDPAFSAPRWATSASRSAGSPADPWYVTGIDPRKLAVWEAMLARRYDGSFTPPGEPAPLPRVQAFTLWNEPNEHGYLAPQWRDGVAVSADWYRRVAELAYPAIKAASPAASVLIGNTSAAGEDAQAAGAGVPPLAFIRRLACVNAQLQPIRDRACADFHTVPGDGYAQHPYERAAPPFAPSPPFLADWAQMGDLPRLQALLDRLVAMHRLALGAARLWLTEQGYESNAQLREKPWSEAQQAQLDAISEYLAWRDPQVSSFSQFLLRDTLTAQTLALRSRTGSPQALVPGTWTTGLERQDGTAKPALAMFRSPIVARIAGAAPAAPGAVTGAGSPGAVIAAGLPALPPASPLMLEVWGRVRPARAPTAVEVLLAGAGAGFHVVRQAITDANGIFDVPLVVSDRPPLRVRFQWLSPGGTWQASPIAAPLAFPAP